MSLKAMYTSSHKKLTHISDRSSHEKKYGCQY